MSTAHQEEEAIRLVLDTSVFTNPKTARQFGKNAAESFERFLELLSRATPQVRAYMPPLIYEELRTFVGEAPLPPRFEILVSLQAPNRYNLQVPGFLLYELIDEMRGRIDRGLRLAERAVRDAHPRGIDRTITRLREKYREVLRAGLIDSREDVDLILLSIELGAALVSSDQGVVRWAERMGVRIVHPEQLRAVLEELAGDDGSVDQADASE